VASTYGITVLVLVAVSVFSATEIWDAKEGLGMAVLLFLGSAWGFAGVVFWLVFTYKMWASIQDGRARTSPCRAVGFLFIPFYNFYWIFQAFWGFARDFNAFIARYSLKVAPLSPSLFGAYAVLTLAQLLPSIGVVFAVANYLVMLAVVSKVADAVNSLPLQAAAAPAMG
jgi:hypothetical protein